MPTSIRDLARELQLSMATVSKALNGYEDVAPGTRDLVRQRARQLGYAPRAAARNLRRGRTDKIALFLNTRIDYVVDYLSAIIPGAGLLGGVNIKKKEAQVVLFLTDNRSGVQIAAAEGSATVSDIGFGGFGIGGGMAALGGAYGSSDQGKVVAAALLDATNKVIDLVRSRSQ